VAYTGIENDGRFPLCPVGVRYPRSGQEERGGLPHPGKGKKGAPVAQKWHTAKLRCWRAADPTNDASPDAQHDGPTRPS
jgi:hypothetical protein